MAVETCRGNVGELGAQLARRQRPVPRNAWMIRRRTVRQRRRRGSPTRGWRGDDALSGLAEPGSACRQPPRRSARRRSAGFLGSGEGARRRPVPGRRVGGRAQQRSTGHHGPRPRHSERPVLTGNRDYGSQPLRSSASTGNTAAGSGHGPQQSGWRVWLTAGSGAGGFLQGNGHASFGPDDGPISASTTNCGSGVARRTIVRIPGFGLIDGSCSDFNAGTPICSFSFHDMGRVMLQLDGVSDSLLRAESPGCHPGERGTQSIWGEFRGGP
jgi:hypothetical protein